MANVTKREKKTCRQLWSSLDTPGPHWTRTRRRLHTWADRSLSWKDVEAHIADVEDVEYVESHIAEDLSFNFSQVEDIGFEKVCLRLSLAWLLGFWKGKTEIRSCIASLESSKQASPTCFVFSISQDGVLPRHQLLRERKQYQQSPNL